MAIADTKKVQTLINMAGYQIIAIRAALSELIAIRDLYTTANPDPTGTPLEGNVTAVNTAINNLNTLINTTDAAVWDGMVAAIVESHRGEAL